MKTIRLSLQDPNLDEGHRVGLAGLHRTLKKPSRRTLDLLKDKDIQYSCDNLGVTFTCPDKMNELNFVHIMVNILYFIEDGLLKLGAYGDDRGNEYVSKEVAVHEALLYGPIGASRVKKLGSFRKYSLSDNPEDEKELKYKSIKSLNILKIQDLKKKQVKRKEEFTYSLNSSISPGRASANGPNGYIKETLVQFLCSLSFYAGCYIYKPFYEKGGSRPTRTSGTPDAILIAPVPTDLDKLYQRWMPYFEGFQPKNIRNSEEAILQVQVALEKRRLEHQRLKDCICGLICYQCKKSSWNPNVSEIQNIRYENDITDEVINTYRLCRDVYVPRLQQRKDGTRFMKYPKMPSFAAQNMLNGRDWFCGLHNFSAQELKWDILICGEEKTAMDEKLTPEAQILVKGIRKSWANHMAHIFESYKGFDQDRKIEKAKDVHLRTCQRLYGHRFVNWVLDFLTKYRTSASAEAASVVSEYIEKPSTKDVIRLKSLFTFAICSYKGTGNQDQLQEKKQDSE